MDSSRTTGAASSDHLLKGAPLNAAAIICTKVVSFVAGIVFARVVGVNQCGMFNGARSVLESCSIVSPLGLDVALPRHLGSARERLSTRLRCPQAECAPTGEFFNTIGAIREALVLAVNVSDLAARP